MPAPSRGGAQALTRPESLDGDLGARSLELLLGGLGGLLVDLLQEGLGSGLDQLLGLLQAQARDDLADDLDDLDLLVAGALEDDVELVLLLDRGGSGGSGAGGDGDRGGGGDVEGVLELLHELGQLEEGELLEGVDQLGGAQLRHDGFLSEKRTRRSGWGWFSSRRVLRLLRYRWRCAASPPARQPGGRPGTPAPGTARRPGTASP